MIRNKAYYGKKQLQQLIAQRSVVLTEQARQSAQDNFGWGLDSICKAILSLPVKSCYKAETRFDNPNIWVDYYRAKNIKGENIYTHFYVDGGQLVIDSFKEL